VTLKKINTDFHIHTCLSPCGDLEMSPQKIVETAIMRQLDMIAITDHNTAENCSAVIGAAAGTSLTVLPGMEITSREEVHIVSLFRDVDQAHAVQNVIYSQLPKDVGNLYSDDQVVANEKDEVEGFCDYLLMGATTMSVKQIVEMVHSYEGLAFAAHIDRMAFGIIAQLGFIPPNVPFDGLEVSSRFKIENACVTYKEYAEYNFITNSDAHFLRDIGTVHNQFYLHNPDFDNLANALAHKMECYLEVGHRA
jgi:PHP family Zn ribbon phosphoesterase